MQNELKEGEVAVKKQDLKALMARVEELEKASKGERVIEEPESHNVRVRMLNGKPVSHMDNVLHSGRQKPNGDEVMTCDVYVVDGGTIKVENVDYLDFLAQCPYDICKVLKEEKTKRTAVEGTSEVTHVDGYKTVGSGVKVPNRVTWYDSEYVVQLKDGSSVKIKTPNL